MASQRLITLPPSMVEGFHRLEPRESPQWFATSDPGKALGSGGGTAHALIAAWRVSGTPDFYDWLKLGRKMVVHAGGQSRRLPAYAAVGKALMPIPAVRGSAGQRPDQALIDLQVGLYDELFDRAPESLRVMIVSGDALFTPKNWPDVVPDGDVVCVGLRADAETARNFGAFFVSPGRSETLEFCLQKPDPVATRERTDGFECVLDVGIWLLSEEAIRVLLAESGVSDPSDLTDLKELDLYTDLGTRLGTQPTVFDVEISPLRTKILAIEGVFHHFGTSRQLIESVTALHDQAHHASPLGFLSSSKRRANQHVQNVSFSYDSLAAGEPYWIENSHLGSGWKLLGDNVVTGVPRNAWQIELLKGACLDVVPIGDSEICLRVYGIDDPFKGAIGDASTLFLGTSLSAWLEARGLSWNDIGDGPQVDIQSASLFPVAEPRRGGDWVRWMTSANPDADMTSEWLYAKRLSAAELLSEANSDRVYAHRRTLLADSLVKMQANHRGSIFYTLDLERTAEIWHRELPETAPADISTDESLVKQMHDRMFRSALSRLKGESRWEAEEQAAFSALREAILGALPPPHAPLCGVAPDQIVWSRSPLRFDLAGGWTDTPPYCLLHGGRVLNMAVNLNGQPPVQVFLRRSERPDILLRSIDLGTETRISSFDQLSGNLTEKSEFSLAQAALGLAGFGPETGETDLSKVLSRFGGGIEMSLLAAVPKGSGLGTSSILASTILAALGEFCSLEWSPTDVMAKTLALEQILSTGGGWQDQAGGCLAGIKELETQAGLIQSPTCRWLPDRILGPENANSVALLYYTGITRVAKSVLREIVRGMFLDSGPRLATLKRIGENVGPTSDAIRRNDWAGLCAGIRRSWELNQELDSGTNTPAVQAILDQVSDLYVGAKLLGAGGGGFLLFFAKDLEAARRIRETLNANPPAPNARFFDFSVSQVGLEVTKS